MKKRQRGWKKEKDERDGEKDERDGERRSGEKNECFGINCERIKKLLFALFLSHQQVMQFLHSPISPFPLPCSRNFPSSHSDLSHVLEIPLPLTLISPTFSLPIHSP